MVDNAIKLDEPYVRHIMSGTSCPAHLLQYDPSRAAISLFALRPAEQVFAERAGRGIRELVHDEGVFPPSPRVHRTVAHPLTPASPRRPLRSGIAHINRFIVRK
jgi:hypothetical protein